MSALFVTLGGAAAIAFIVWWFWLSRPKAASIKAERSALIRVEDGTYQPAALEVSSGQSMTLTFIRRDATPCAEKVIFPALGLTVDLPLDKPIAVALPPLAPGQYAFTCQMGMYRGTLIAT